MFSWLSRLLGKGKSAASPWEGNCDKCHHRFEYTMAHNGFNESAYSYCDQCGMTSLLYWDPTVPAEAQFKLHGPISLATEDYLLPCRCGGKFRRDASPRCTNCKHPLDPVKAGTYIERNAPGTKSGYRWQRSWKGSYAIIIDGRDVRDNWDPAKMTQSGGNA